MQVLYKSTRGKGETVTASMAILKGLSEDGGLFVPTEIPKLAVPAEKLAQMTYQETAYEVMSRFLKDLTKEELKKSIANEYDEKIEELSQAVTRYEQKINELQAKIVELNADNRKLQETMRNGMVNAGNSDQVDILKRISRLEQAVFHNNQNKGQQNRGPKNKRKYNNAHPNNQNQNKED